MTFPARAAILLRYSALYFDRNENMKQSVICVIGNAPKAIKSAPDIKALRSIARNLDRKGCSTGQHGPHFSDEIHFFDRRPDGTPFFLKSGQSLSVPTPSAVLELGGTNTQDRGSPKLGADSLWLCLQVMGRTSEV